MLPLYLIGKVGGISFLETITKQFSKLAAKAVIEFTQSLDVGLKKYLK